MKAKKCIECGEKVGWLEYWYWTGWHRRCLLGLQKKIKSLGG